MWTRGALALAVAAAWMLALRVPTRRQRELAAGLAALLAVDVARIWELPPRVDHALSVAWYAVTTALVWRATVERPRWLVSKQIAAGFVLASIALAILPGTIVATFWLALAAQILASARLIARREIPDQVATVGLILAASSVADVAGPWLLANPTRDWYTNQWPAVATWIAIAAWEGRCWTRAGRSSG